MKIIHCGDIHLDSKMESNISKEKAKERKNEILMTFINMVEYAKFNEVKVIIIAGDLFDTKRVSITTKNLVKNSIIANPDIDFLYLKGNHDNENFISDLEEELPANLKLFRDQWTSYKYGNIVISGTELTNKNMNIIYNTLILDKSNTNIVVLHGQESKYSGNDNTEVINLTNLKNRNIDYLALGHIHSYKHEKLDDRGVYCYCGCLEGRGFDECGDKGFVLLNIEDGKVYSEFIKFARRTLHEIHVDVTNSQTTGDIETAIINAVSDIPIESLIKIILEGKVNVETEKNIIYLNQKFSQNLYFTKIYDKTRLAIDIEDYKYDISLKGEFIRLVLSEILPDDEKEQIILNGINALSGEEID